MLNAIIFIALLVAIWWAVKYITCRVEKENENRTGPAETTVEDPKPTEPSDYYDSPDWKDRN